MTIEQRHISNLIRAWAAGQERPLPWPDGVDVAAVKASLCEHNVEAILGPLLDQDVDGSGFSAKIEESRTRTELLLLECERILPILTTKSCQPVLLKGAALALSEYRDPFDRWFLDLDILVPAAEVDGACQRLQSLGYRPLRGGRDPLFYEKYHLHRMMLGPQGAVVELHWDLTLPGSVYQYDVNGVAERAISRKLGRLEVLCAAPVDQILHGVYQNIADGFVDLRRVLDCILLLDSMQEPEWVYLAKQAHKTGMDIGLWMSLHMVKLLSGRSAPEATLAILRPGRLIRRVCAGLQIDRACLARQGSTAEDYVQMMHLLATPGNRRRCREALRSLCIGEGTLLDLGHRPDNLPGFARRSLIALRRFKTLLLVTWRVARAAV